MEKAIEFHLQHLEITRALKDRHGEALASWNLGLTLEKRGCLAEAIPLMEVYVRFLQDIGHPDTGKRAARVAALRQRLASGS